MRFVGYGLTTAFALFCGVASAQTVTAYQSGLRLAERRGYANAECYARVFARHAVVVEKADGRRNWFAASTPAYNAEQRARCGVDRLADISARRQFRTVAFQTAPAGAGGAYSAGLRVAAQRGHSGAKAACFARTYATFASVRPSTNGKIAHAISGRDETAYVAELASQCGISR